MNGAIRRGAIALVVGIAALALVLIGMTMPGNRANGGQPEAQVLPIPASAEAYAAGQLVVGLHGDRSSTQAVQQAVEALGFSVPSVLLRAPAGAAVLLVETDDAHQDGAALSEAAKLVASVPGVSFVQPNYRYATAATAADLVEDPDAVEQGYLNSWDESHGANVVAAWEGAAANARVDVAVLDTGMYSMTDYNDGELVANDPRDFHQEFDADNLDMAAGRDFVHSGDELLPLVNAANPTGDDNGHGTHVSAIIAAGSSRSGAEGVGMAGVSPNARIIPCKVLDSSGEGDTANFIRAYDYLLNGGFEDLHVINLSASLAFDDSGTDGPAAADDVPEVETDGEFEFVDEDGDMQDEALRAAMAQAQDRGIVTVCAAGNEGSDALVYPGNYPECICVAALDADGKVAPFSNMNEHVDIAAPGVGIYSAWANQADAYTTLDGTSQATAIVSGVLSMMFAANPELSVAGAKGALYQGGTVPGTSADGGSHGALDAARALDAAMRQSAEWDSTADEEKWKAAVAASEAVEPISIASAKVSVAKKSYAYTGKKLKPAVTVTLDGEPLVKGVDYKVSYSANKKPGTAKVVVTGMGDYAGTANGSFKIALGKTKVKKLAKGKKSFTVTWKKQKKGKVGYQIRYSLNKDMKNAKKKTVKKNATTKLKVGKLKSGKRYYVQVRTYKKIGGKKYYSAWSAAKSVKVR